MYTKILVPLDGSELAECVLPQVEAITTGCQVSTVVFVRVAERILRSACVPVLMVRAPGCAIKL